MMAHLFLDNPVKSSRVVVPDQLPCSVVSYLGFHALPKSVGLNARLKWVKGKKISNDHELIQSDPTSCPIN